MPDSKVYDDRLNELKKAYVNRLEDSVLVVKSCNQFLEKEQWNNEIYNQLKFIANNLSGSGRTYGFEDLSNTAQWLSEGLNDPTMAVASELSKDSQNSLLKLTGELLNVMDAIKKSNVSHSSQSVYSFLSGGQESKQEEMHNHKIIGGDEKPHILVAGGKQTFRQILVESLEKNNFDVFKADSIESAVSLIVDGLPDLVLLVEPVNEDESDIITAEIISRQFIRNIPLVRLMERSRKIFSSSRKQRIISGQDVNIPSEPPIERSPCPVTEHYMTFSNVQVMIRMVNEILGNSKVSKL